MAGTLVARLRAGISRELGAHLHQDTHPPHLTLFHLVWFIYHGNIADESQPHTVELLLVMFDQLNYPTQSGMDQLAIS